MDSDAAHTTTVWVAGFLFLRMLPAIVLAPLFGMVAEQAVRTRTHTHPYTFTHPRHPTPHCSTSANTLRRPSSTAPAAPARSPVVSRSLLAQDKRVAMIICDLISAAAVLGMLLISVATHEGAADLASLGGSQVGFLDLLPGAAPASAAMQMREHC